MCACLVVQAWAEVRIARPDKADAPAAAAEADAATDLISVRRSCRRHHARKHAARSNHSSAFPIAPQTPPRMAT
jgi:hypothetical protein